MFVNHFAVGVATKSVAPKIPTCVLLLVVTIRVVRSMRIRPST